MSDTSRVTVHTEAPPPGTVVPPERDVRTGRPGAHQREDKGRRRDDAGRSQPARARRPRTRLLVGAGAAVAAIALVSAAVFATGGSDPDRTPEATVAGTGSTLASGDTTAASQPPGDTGTTSPQGATTQGPDSSTEPGLPPALDPERIFGYQATATRSLVEVGPNVEIPPDEVVGSVTSSLWLCQAGVCSRGGDTAGFAPAAESFSDSVEFTDPDSRCYPITVSVELTRNDDGSYSGTFSFDPAEVFAEWEDGTLLSSCTAPRTVDDLTLVPLVKLDPAEGPDLSLPAELDPHRISGYIGIFIEDGAERGAEVSCDGGICVLRCDPLCGSVLAFPAAAEKWTASGIAPMSLCGEGSTSLQLVRGPDGTYSGSATTDYVGGAGPGCPTEMQISLSPLTTGG